MHSTTKRLIRTAVLAAAISAAMPVTAASFIYRGALSDGGEPAEGQYGFRLTFHDAQNGGAALARPITLDGVTVSNGTFSAALELPPALESHENLWLGVEVRDANGLFTALSAREAVQPKAIAAGVCWDTTGNTGNVDSVNFLGNIDAVPVDFRANNSRVLRLDPNTDPGLGDVPSVVAGSRANSTGAAIGATVAGGGSTVLVPGAPAGFGDCPAGLCGNRAEGNFAAVGGGRANFAIGEHSVVSGGLLNSAGTDGVVAGGFQNGAGTAGAVGGGRQNRAAADFSVVPGGRSNFAGGAYSFAAGRSAAVRSAQATGDADGDEGAFVWSDAVETTPAFTSTGPNQFLVRAAGGVALNSTTITGADDLVIGARSDASGGDADSDLRFRTRSNRDASIYVRDTDGAFVFNGAANFAFAAPPVAARFLNTGANGAHLTTGGAWTNGSSRLFKEAVSRIDAGAILDKVLALPVSTWRYKDSIEGTHLGPMAEDFSAAFGLGGDNQHIATVDADGVALAAIQGLNAKLERENRELRARNAEIAARNATLDARLTVIERLLSRGADL